jgi:glycosyltransferase involved in cell wall biosynthesis
MHIPPPRFSVIIPTRDRPDALARCLSGFERLDFPVDRFEIVVVDDGSASSLRPVVDRFRDALRVTLHEQRNAGPASARNAGAARAQGDFLAFIDDDCVPSPGWLGALDARLDASPSSAVGGHTVNLCPENAYSAASQTLVDYLYAYYNATPERAAFLTSNNLAVPASLFHEVGGFSAEFRYAAAEDRDFCERWRSGGYEMIYAPEATIHHAHLMGLRGFVRQHFLYGRGARHLARVRTREQPERPHFEPPAFYTSLLWHPLRTLRGSERVRSAALIAVTQVAHTVGFVWESLTRVGHAPAAAPSRVDDNKPAH